MVCSLDVDMWYPLNIGQYWTLVILTMMNHTKQIIVEMGRRGYRHVGLIGIVRFLIRTIVPERLDILYYSIISCTTLYSQS